MADIWNLNALCRCCHKDGYFRSMQYPYVGKDGEVEVYSSWLKEVFGINMETPSVPASIMICEDCIVSLRDGRKFKKQVIDCELRFQQYCQNEVKAEPGENSQSDESKESKLLQGFNNDFLQKAKDNTIQIKIEPDNDPHYNTDNVTVKNVDHFDNTDHFDNNDFDSDSDLEPLIAKKENIKKGKKNDTSVKGKVTKQKTIKAKVTFKMTKKGKVATKTQRKVSKESSNKPITEKVKEEICYRCHKCGLYHKNIQEMKQHMATEHKEPEVSCQFCEEKFEGLLKYKSHIYKKHPGVGIVCRYCPEIYPQGYLLKSHVQKCHPPAEKIVYICDHCQREFLGKSILRTHILRVHMKNKKTTYTCDICNLQTYDKIHLKLHIEQVHENIRKFQCTLCPKNYKTGKSLKEHTRVTHTFERPYVCETCGEAFVTQSNLNKHTFRNHYEGEKKKVLSRKVKWKDGTIQEVPPGGRIFRCFMCKEAFQGRGGYIRHLNKDHKGMLPHQCHICAKSFASSYVLRRHILSHETTRKIQCHLCPRKFKHEIFLTAHVKRTHGHLNRDGTPRVSKEHYVKCDICHRMVPNIDKHKAQHFKRPFKCHLCERDYSMNNALQRHIRETHLGISFSCNICEKKFSKPRSVTRHKEKHHRFEFERERQMKTEIDA